MTKIHDSGKGAERIRVDSYHNGLAYNIFFGEFRSPMRNVFLQGDDAAAFRDQWGEVSAGQPGRDDHDIISDIMSDYC